MDANEDRVTRAQRRRVDPQAQENTQQPEQGLEEDASSSRRRRRAQPAPAPVIEDAMMDDTIIPPSKEALKQKRIYGPPNEEDDPESPEDRKRDMLFADDPEDDYAFSGRSTLYGEDDDEYEEVREKSHLLRWVVICTVILALLAGITYIGLQRPDLIEPVVKWGNELLFGPPPPTVEPPTPTPVPDATPTSVPDASMAKVVSLSASPVEQPNINLPISFQVTTTEQTTRVRIVDRNGQILIEGLENDYTDVSYGRVWNLTVYFLAPYEGNVEANPGNESGWNEANSSLISIKVGDSEASETPEPGPVPGIEGVGEGEPDDTPVEIGQGVVPDPDQGIQQTMAVSFEVAPVESSGRIIIGGEAQDTFARETAVLMGDEAGYRGATGMNGVLTFRGSGMRQNAAFGEVSPAENRLESLWSASVGTPGDGHATWGTQPLIVQWHANIRQLMPLGEEKRNKQMLKEVIFTGNDGVVYFFDLEDGAQTRETMEISPVVPMLGGPSVHPNGLPLLMLGTGDPANTNPDADTGLRIYNLIEDTKAAGLVLIRNDRAEAVSSDKSYVTSPLVETSSGVMIAVGGNGLLYTMTLHPTIDIEAGELKISPTLESFGATVGTADMTVDSSLAAYGEAVYYATNGGILLRVDVNTLTTDWAVDLGVDTDAAIALEADDATGQTALYTGSRADAEGYAHMRRLDAETGDVLWDFTAIGNCSASPLVGHGSISRLAIFTVSGPGFGTVFALDKEIGEVAWEYTLDSDTASSPIALYDDGGNAWIVQGNATGLALIDGQTGEHLGALALSSPVIGSPAAFDNMLVVATQDATIHGIALR